MKKPPLPPISTRAEAYARRETVFYTGKPCRRGHLSVRYVSTGNCLECLHAFKGEGAKNPFDHNLVPYTPRTVWRPAYWDVAALEGVHAVVQKAIDDYEAKRQRENAPKPPAVATDFAKLYGEHHVAQGSIVVEGVEYPLWWTRNGTPRTQILVQEAREPGARSLPLFYEEALTGQPWVYHEDAWCVYDQMNGIFLKIVALPDALAWAKFGKDGKSEVPTGTGA